jgi:N-acetylglucosaminyl-diphospho-decaprenol L-rhamnosyltransferase
MTPRITVVIVTHHSADDLAVCLDSLPQASSVPLNTVVIDNATSDDSVAAVVRNYPDVTFLDAGGNLGYGTAINRAVAARGADSDWLLIVNPDTQFTPDSIDMMLRTAQGDPRIGAVGPRIENADGTVYPSARALPSIRMGVGHALFSQVWPSNPWTRAYQHAELAGGSSSTAVPVGWLSGACLLVRASAFSEIEGFDEGYFMYFEDVDLGSRLASARWKNVYEPRSVVRHMGGTSTARYPAKMLAMHHDSANRYLSKKYHGWYLAPLRGAIRVGLNVRLWLMTRNH